MLCYCAQQLLIIEVQPRQSACFAGPDPYSRADLCNAHAAQVVVNNDKQQVEMWLVSKADTGEVAPGISIAADERLLVEISRKFTPEKLQGLAYSAGLYMQVRSTYEAAVWGRAETTKSCCSEFSFLSLCARAA